MITLGIFVIVIVRPVCREILPFETERGLSYYDTVFAPLGLSAIVFGIAQWALTVFHWAQDILTGWGVL